MSRRWNPGSFKETQAGLSAFLFVSGRSFLRLALPAVAAVLFIVSPATEARAPGDSKPAVHLKNVSLERIDWKKRIAELKLAIQMDNPGPAFKLRDLAYRIRLNDKQAASGKYQREIPVPANSSARFDVPCTVDLSALPGVAWGIIAGGFDLRYELETDFTLPLLPQLSPRLKTTIGGDLSLVRTVTGWTARIKERLSSKQ